MDTDKRTLTYAEGIERLGNIVVKIEKESPDVDELIRLTEEAVRLISFCREKLTRTDKCIEEMLTKLNDDEAPSTKEG